MANIYLLNISSPLPVICLPLLSPLSLAQDGTQASVDPHFRVLYLWGSRAHRFFPLFLLTYVNIIIKSSREPRREEGEIFP